MGIVLVAFLAAWISLVPPAHDDINLETHQLGRKLRIPFGLVLRISVLAGDVLSFYVAKLAQSQPNSLGTSGVTPHQIPYPGNFLRLLGLGGRAKRKEQSTKGKTNECQLPPGNWSIGVLE